MKAIAVTGVPASGKSSVCHFFGELGARVVSADQIVHQLLSNDADLGKKVVDFLGKEVLKGEKLDRQLMAAKVFDDPKLLKQLEAILHPGVFAEINQIRQGHRNGLLVVEIPLLFETESHGSFDATIAVVAEPSLCAERMGPTFERRARHQLPQEEKAKRADHIINNNGTLAELRTRVATLYAELIKDHHEPR